MPFVFSVLVEQKQKQMPVPRGYRSVEGRCPFAEGTCEFGVSQSLLVKYQRNGPDWKFYDALLIPEVLASPAAIFEGLRREDYEDALCYSARPSRRFKSSTIEVPFPPDRVMLVYVENHKTRGLIVLDWDSRKRHATDQGHPQNWEHDFGRRIWPAT